ncbi:MAG TPA: zf-HC2 domain-containing protein [Planctomycetota bacterium]|jgi:anti-sigma factor RsiW
MAEQTLEIDCNQCRDLLSDYVDRELSADERSAVERHLGQCTKCGVESTRVMGLKKIVQHWEGVKGSGEFHKIVMQKMIQESQKVPSQQFTEAADRASGRNQAQPAPIEEPEEVRTLPPIWILLAAAVLAVVAYYFVLWLRGV